MEKTFITPATYGKTHGGYTPAIKIDLGSAEMIFVSGIQPKKIDGDHAFTDDIEEQTENVFQSIGEILNEAGATFDDVIKAQIFITDMQDFPKVSAIRDKYFANSKPVSTLLEVNAMTRKGSKFEMEVIAVKNKIN
jgi:2-iminobutanoate/2-iminopropanoate deaminase